MSKYPEGFHKKIARKRQRDLRKKLGDEGYSKVMSRVRAGKKVSI